MKKSYIYAATSILCWSTVATVSKLLLTNLNNIQLLNISSLVAALFFLILNIVNGNIKKLKQYTLKDYLMSLIISVPATFLYYIFYYGGTDMMPASQAFIINYLWPIMSVLFACIILREKLTVRKLTAIIISFIGVMIVAGNAVIKLDKTAMLGSLFCVLGAISYGVFTALNKKYEYDKSISMMLGYFLSFVLTLFINIADGSTITLTFAQIPLVIWNGVFTIAIANFSWVLALRNGNTARISNLAYITPFLSLVWTSVFLKEQLALNSIIGFAVIIAGILIQLKKSKV